MPTTPNAVSPPRRTGTAIATAGLRKTFRRSDAPALDGVDLEVTRGRVCVLLGANGAGKTTLTRVLTTLTRPDAGTASVAGFDVVGESAHVRAVVGLVGQAASLDEQIGARANLRLFARLSGLSRRDARSRSDALLEQAGLGDLPERPVATLSGGQRRRLDLAVGLLTRPEVLFVDEPTTGLDPHARRALWAAVRERAADGATVLLTTQDLDEADALADDVVVLRAGRVLARGTADELRRLAGEPRTVEVPPTLEDVYLHLHADLQDGRQDHAATTGEDR